MVAAAKALDEPARLAFVEKVGGAFKTLVMSETFAKAHADSIKQEHNAVDHGITGLVSMEELLKRKDFAAIEARNKGQSAAAIVDNMESENAKTLQLLISQNLESWTRNAENVNRKDRAKYQKMVRDAQALQALGASDVQKLRRGVAVLYSMDQGGPDTEQALYALRDRAEAESEQLAWDQYNLKTVLREATDGFCRPGADGGLRSRHEGTGGHGALRQPGPREERPGLEGLLPSREADQRERDGDGPGLAQGTLRPGRRSRLQRQAGPGARGRGSAAGSFEGHVRRRDCLVGGPLSASPLRRTSMNTAIARIGVLMWWRRAMRPIAT